MNMFILCTNFAKLIAYDGESMTILMRYYPDGSLNKYILTVKNKPIRHILQIFGGIANALTEMHSHGIVHNDIKPDNVLLHKQTNGGLCSKLIDFGVSNVVDTNSLAVKAFSITNRRGLSYMYAAPERTLFSLLKNNDYIGMTRKFPKVGYLHAVKSCDVYSFSMVMFEVLTSTDPWTAKK